MGEDVRISLQLLIDTGEASSVYEVAEAAGIVRSWLAGGSGTPVEVRDSWEMIKAFLADDDVNIPLSAREILLVDRWLTGDIGGWGAPLEAAKLCAEVTNNLWKSQMGGDHPSAIAVLAWVDFLQRNPQLYRQGEP